MTEASKGKHWPWIIVALLVGNAAAVAMLVGFSSSGDSHHVVPDYYEKAVAWDDTMAQQRANEALGWSIDLDANGAAADGVVVTLVVRDRDGAPVEGAAIEVGAFHRAHAASVLRARAADGGDGRYVVHLPVARAGLWQLDMTATRGAEVFTATLVRDLAPGGGGA